MELFILCLKIFVGRLVDVTLATMVTLYIVKNKRLTAAIIGFIDVFIWFVIVREALVTESTSLLIPLFYSGGYACGTLLGSKISSKTIKSIVTVSIVTSDIDSVSQLLIDNKIGGTIMKGTGLNSKEDSYVIFSQIEGNKLKQLEAIVKKEDPSAYIVITESREALNGYFEKHK
jgi:uncharacterized protein YebE (UPF0316 family)